MDSTKTVNKDDCQRFFTDQLTVNFDVLGLNDEQLFKLCSTNKGIKIERNSKGELILCPPPGMTISFLITELNAEMAIWNRKSQTGKVTGYSSGYFLKNSAMRSPDAAWISNERLSKYSKKQLESFFPECPDFVVEIMSKTDALKSSKEKMHEWIENGCRLGWLIDPHGKKTYVYLENGEIEIVRGFDTELSGETVCKGFKFKLSLLK